MSLPTIFIFSQKNVDYPNPTLRSVHIQSPGIKLSAPYTSSHLLLIHNTKLLFHGCVNLVNIKPSYLKLFCQVQTNKLFCAIITTTL